MIKNISDKLSKLKDVADNSQTELLKEKNIGDLFLYVNSKNHDNSSNPFEKNEKEIKIQEYFNSKYYKINSKIKDVVFRITDKSGDIENFINDSILDYSAVISKYFYDGDFKVSANDNRKYSLSRNNDGINVLSITKNDCNVKIEFTKTSFVKIEENKNLETISLIFRKHNLFQKIFALSGSSIKKYIKTDSSGNKTEEIYFSRQNKAEKYIKYRAGKKEFEIIFDTSDWQYLTEKSNKTLKVIPLEYYGYDFLENVIEKLTFQYAKPSKYSEFNSNTGKVTKTFNLQGLSSVVTRYTFYNSLTGQMLAFGTL